MAAFHIYGDESGKMSSNADRTSFCGYVASHTQWQMFNEVWNNCRFKWQVPPIHMSRIMFPDNKDDGWKQVKLDWGTAWEKKRELMLREFSEIIRDSHAVCVGAVVDAKHFRSLADSDNLFKKAHRDPIHMALHTFVMRGIDRTEVIDTHSPIGIVVDDDPEYAVKCYEQFESLKATFPRVRDRVHAISFVDDNSYPGVQAADMIAYEARRCMVERMTNPSYTSELYDNLTFLRIHQPNYYTPEVLSKLQADLQESVNNGSVKV